MLTRAEIDRWLTLLGPNDTKLKMALETAQKLGHLLAALRSHCVDCEVNCNGPKGYEEQVCPMAIAEREADAWIGGKGK